MPLAKYNQSLKSANTSANHRARQKVLNNPLQLSCLTQSLIGKPHGWNFLQRCTFLCLLEICIPTLNLPLGMFLHSNGDRNVQAPHCSFLHGYESTVYYLHQHFYKHEVLVLNPPAKFDPTRVTARAK
ncbi:hypothetical protein EUGRSUZ_E00734 [Eucalyptus grandis]|uniref:Uncharacterized protein n=2 Tax=Eucalyptus grandis TaxID=71139 RepID=A0ACC3KT06_EUCGR|nr:hypothetical protein EUGRSUZ_E00734 [Eucalyptus grandis]